MAAGLEMEQNRWTGVPERRDELNLLELLPLWGTILLISALILLGTAQKLFSVLALGAAAYMIAFAEDANTVVMLVAITPIANIFKAAPGSTSFHTYLMLLFSLKMFVTKRTINAASILFGIYFVAVQLATVHLEVTTTIKLMSNIWFLDAAYMVWNRKEPRSLFYGFILGTFNCSLFRMMDSSVFRVTRYVAVENLSRIYGVEGGVRFSGCYNDPNYYSVNVIIALCLIVILLNNRKLAKAPAAALVLFFLYCCYLTYSKSALLMLVLPLMLYLGQNIKEGRTAQVAVIITMLFAGLIFLLYRNPEVFSVVIARMSEGGGGGLNALTTGRTDIWGYYFDYFFRNPLMLLFGGSPYNFSPVHGRASHNTPLEMLYHLGLLGTALFLAAGVTIYEEYHIRHRHSFMNLSVAIGVLVTYMFLSQLFLIDIPVHVLLSFLVMDLPNTGERLQLRGS